MSNETIRNIKGRRSVRKYIDKNISKAILEDLIDCGRLAPSGNNRQAWTFIIVTEQNLKEKIASYAQYGKFIKEAATCIAVFLNEKETSTPLQDAAAATENIMIAASSYGLGSCWVSSYKRAHSEEVKKLLNCPDNMELMTLISVGHYDESTLTMPKKKSLDQVLKWNKF